MKVGIIADTHIKKNSKDLDEFLNKNFSNIDMLIHVGDYNSAEVVDKLKQFKKFKGVWGNNDGALLRECLKEKEILYLGGYKVGLFHGHGLGKTSFERAYDTFKKEKVDIIIFGHSHQPIIKTQNKVLMLNPGSPMKKRKERWYSYIILEIDQKRIDARLVFF